MQETAQNQKILFSSDVVHGSSLKKRSGGRLKQDLDKDF